MSAWWACIYPTIVGRFKPTDSKMAQTYTYFILILTAWGLWGFFGKYALRFISPLSLVFYEVIGSLIMQAILLAYLFYTQKNFDKNAIGMSVSIISGFISTMGVIIFYLALSNTKASVLVPLTALYPVVTVILSLIFLKEKISVLRGIGIALAVAASVLLSI